MIKNIITLFLGNMIKRYHLRIAVTTGFVFAVHQGDKQKTQDFTL